MAIINKRYRDIFEEYIYKNQQTPLTIGTLAVCAFCFLLLIIATFFAVFYFTDGLEELINMSKQIGKA